MLNFLLYFSLVIALWAAAIAVYVRITPYPEFRLAREGNLAATISLVGTALGLALPLASLAAHAVSLMDLALWAGVALAIQLLCWVVLARLVQKRLWLRRVLKRLQMRQWHRLYLRQLWRLIQ
jgi:putative membrane protein